jgi:chorismate dehydratase
MIRISLVSYCNTLPFKAALESSDYIKKNAILKESHPAQCAYDIENNLADISLVPVGALKESEKYNVITDYCLSANKKVESVLLLSEKPRSEINSILLDYQSKTSVKLIKIIANKFWENNFKYIDAKPGFEDGITGNIAALIIGDRALKLRNSFPFVYDLAEEWYNYTDLPAVFAVWVAKNDISLDFISNFNSALSSGINSIKQVANKYACNYQGFDLEHYLTNCIDYHFNETKRQSMAKFLQLAQEI